MKNMEVRMAMLQNGVRSFEVAEKVGVTAPTFSRWLQTELPKDKKQKILAAIKEMKEGV